MTNFGRELVVSLKQRESFVGPEHLWMVRQ